MTLNAFVPLVTHPEASSDAFAVRAVAFSSMIGARVSALAINADFPDVSNALSRLLLDTPQLIRDAEAASRDHGERLLAAIRTAAATAGVDADTRAVSGALAGLSDLAAAEARYFDLSIIGLEAENIAAEATAEAVIFGSGRPVVLLPERETDYSLDQIAIGWDGSRAAARAVADAGPLLRRASRISVITVLDEKPLKEKDAGERLANALRGHGHTAEVLAIRAEDGPIDTTLQRTAMDNGCGLLVMGGYGHSRMRDFVLGGATQGVLTDLRLPILLSH